MLEQVQGVPWVLICLAYQVSSDGWDLLCWLPAVLTTGNIRKPEVYWFGVKWWLPYLLMDMAIPIKRKKSHADMSTKDWRWWASKVWQIEATLLGKSMPFEIRQLNSRRYSVESLLSLLKCMVLIPSHRCSATWCSPPANPEIQSFLYYLYLWQAYFGDFHTEYINLLNF